MGGRKFFNILEKSMGSRNGGECQIMGNAGFIQFFFEFGISENRFYLRTEVERAVLDGVVKWLDAHMVPGGEECFLFLVPNGESEHPVQFFGDCFAPLFVSVKDDFRILRVFILCPRFTSSSRMGLKLYISPLNVIHTVPSSFVIGQVFFRKVDDGEPPLGQADLAVRRDIIGVAVRSAMF